MKPFTEENIKTFLGTGRKMKLGLVIHDKGIWYPNLFGLVKAVEPSTDMRLNDRTMQFNKVRILFMRYDAHPNTLHDLVIADVFSVDGAEPDEPLLDAIIERLA